MATIPNNKRVDVGTIRRQQIVDAAIAVITEQGIQHLSLSEIEKKTAMARGQLTYYFPSKEDILLAVFDRVLRMMHEHAECKGGTTFASEQHGWERMRVFLTWFVLNPPNLPGFEPLQYTFLAQMGHRDDFRERLARLYDGWRTDMAADVATALADKAADVPVSPRTVASFVQAILHGLAIQRAADADAYDRQEMLDLILHVLEAHLRQPVSGGPARNGTHPKEPASSAAKAPRRRGPSKRRDHGRDE